MTQPQIFYFLALILLIGSLINLIDFKTQFKKKNFRKLQKEFIDYH
jgi:hypothetical protein